ncbi:hypothetical protein ACUYPC_003107 [Enterobacter hormaechei]
MFDETETIDGNPKSWAAWKREAERLQKIIDEMTTNNHPAHGPVSLERLHQIREILSKAAAQSDGGNLGYAMADAVKVIDSAIAAFGAEPVAVNDDMAYTFHHALSDSSLGADEVEEIKIGLRAAFANIATPQPASVVSGEYGDAYQGAREDLAIWKRRALEAEKEVQRLSDINDYLVKEAQGEVRMGEPLIHEAEPVVPDELLSVMEEVLRISDRDHEAWHKARNGIAACRAAMLQGAEPVTTAYKLREAVETIRNSGIAIDAEKIFAERDALNAPDCWCRACRPITLTDMRFVVCPDCGNKRCPHANDHRNACTGSNEPGQEGSAYPAAPQQEVTQALAKGMERYGDAMQELAQREMK